MRKSVTTSGPVWTRSFRWVLKTKSLSDVDIVLSDVDIVFISLLRYLYVIRYSVFSRFSSVVYHLHGHS